MVGDVLWVPWQASAASTSIPTTNAVTVSEVTPFPIATWPAIPQEKLDLPGVSGVTESLPAVMLGVLVFIGVIWGIQRMGARK
jgi:hypothetical protein